MPDSLVFIAILYSHYRFPTMFTWKNIKNLIPQSKHSINIIQAKVAITGYFHSNFATVKNLSKPIVPCCAYCKIVEDNILVCGHYQNAFICMLFKLKVGYTGATRPDL